MPILCGAYTTRYVGKGKDRKEFAGHCVYDQGHDGPCLPPQLLNVDWVPVPKAEMAEAKALVAASKDSFATMPQTFAAAPPLYQRLAELIEGWPEPGEVPGA